MERYILRIWSSVSSFSETGFVSHKSFSIQRSQNHDRPFASQWQSEQFVVRGVCSHRRAGVGEVFAQDGNASRTASVGELAQDFSFFKPSLSRLEHHAGPNGPHGPTVVAL